MTDVYDGCYPYEWPLVGWGFRVNSQTKDPVKVMVTISNPKDPPSDTLRLIVHVTNNGSRESYF